MSPDHDDLPHFGHDSAVTLPGTSGILVQKHSFRQNRFRTTPGRFTTAATPFTRGPSRTRRAWHRTLSSKAQPRPKGSNSSKGAPRCPASNRPRPRLPVRSSTSPAS